VKFDGPVPHPTRVSMSAEPSCMKQHPSGVPAEDVVVDQGGGLENVVVYISDATPPTRLEPPKDEVTFEQKGCMYHPHVVAMQANQKLRIVNDDPTMHNIHPVPQNNREWNKSQPPGMQPVEETFPREEVAIPVRCNVHPWMKGYIAVFKHPYFAVSGKDGSFDIRNLPPGTYTLHAWHEKLGTLTKRVTVGPDRAADLELVFKGR
jgi:plastocyanin